MEVCPGTTRADPGFLEGGFKSIKRGSFSTFYLIFHKFSHEIEIIWSQRGVQGNTGMVEPPLNPPLNSVDKITDSPNISIAVGCGHKALNQSFKDMALKTWLRR